METDNKQINKQPCRNENCRNFNDSCEYNCCKKTLLGEPVVRVCGEYMPNKRASILYQLEMATKAIEAYRNRIEEKKELLAKLALELKQEEK